MIFWIFCGILLFLVLLLSVKLFLIQKGLDEISTGFREHLSSDTNTPLSISSGDPHLRKLAAEINSQLCTLRDARRRFQQGDRELKEAVTNISHDLRTPLTAICGYLDLLDRESTDCTVSHYLSQIRNRTETMTGLTEELFRCSVMVSVPDLHPKRTDIARLLEETLLSFYAVIHEKGIRPDIRLPETPVWRQLDASAASRVFANIISNAIKYSAGDFSVSMTPDGCITFSNTAQSLDPVAVGRLFDRFYTIETCRSSTGLGLSIARSLTERMGGSICADYKDGKLFIQLDFSKS